MHRLKSICVLVVGVSARLAMAQSQCEGLSQLKLEHAEIASATWIAAGQIPVNAGPPAVNLQTVPHCEVKGVARPSSDSEINFTLWLPASQEWNGKYLQVGNGGWAGSVPTPILVEPLARGYAVSGTDDGHREGANPLDPTWAIGHPEKVIDFGYRAVHQTANLSKKIIEAYYSKPSSRGYFFGCSDGGREALMEAERYPEDFDGIVAGAPANHWTHHFAGFIWNEIALIGKPGGKITTDNLPAIEKAALAQCDALDGVKDGLIEDPRACHFDPTVLLCQGPANNSCLTQPQIDSVKAIYAGPKDPKTGQQIYPGYAPGTEAEPDAWSPWIIGNPEPAKSIQFGFGNGFFRDVVYENSQWDWRKMDLDANTREADERVGSVINSYNPDLRSFRDHGGKLIQYHGWADAAIAPTASIEFYDKVEHFLQSHPDPRASDAGNIRAFYRLFMVPGMMHCFGGPGPVHFGNDPGFGSPALPADAEHNVLVALDEWVQKGTAPNVLIGTGTALTRPLCVYPKIAHYTGQGDTHAAQNFTCVDGPNK